jgi:hypothetical protein
MPNAGMNMSVGVRLCSKNLILGSMLFSLQEVVGGRCNSTGGLKWTGYVFECPELGSQLNVQAAAAFASHLLVDMNT